MKARVLFTSATQSSELFLGLYSPTDHLAYRLTRDQEPFVLHGHTHVSPLHLIAQNISARSVVLEYPSMEQFRDELRHGYEYLAISFKAMDADRVLEMCAAARELAPGTRIVLGGYGAVCSPVMFENAAWQGRYDHICRGEGVAFMRELIGDDCAREIECRLPKEGATLPWLSARSLGTVGVILSGIGCTYKCPFCATSAYTSGRYVEVMNAEQIHRTMLRYWRSSPFTNSVSIYDENFLDHRDKVAELGKLIREDEEFGLGRYNYAAFGSLSAVSQWEPEELLLNGLDTVWIGVESKFTALPKRRGASPSEVIRQLHSIGIKTIGSWIIGSDCQTLDNIEEDEDYFVSLDTTFQQLSIMTVFPSLPEWRLHKRRGRIPDDVQWKDLHLYGRSFDHEHLSHPTMVERLAAMYRRIHEQNGPALMKVLELSLNGFEYCRRSEHALLRHDKAEFFRRRASSYSPMLRAARAFAPSPSVLSRLDALKARCHELFGAPSVREREYAELILSRAEAEMERRERSQAPVNWEPFRRYTYADRSARPYGRPYEVEYPTTAPPTESTGFAIAGDASRSL